MDTKMILLAIPLGVIELGLAILAIEFQWTRNLLKRVKDYIDRKRHKASAAHEPKEPTSPHHKDSPGSSS